MRQLGVFSTRGRDLFLRGDQVIARTHRGLEAGEVLCEATDAAVAQLNDPKQGQILRRATDDDVRDLRKMLEQERREYAVCEQEIARLGLEMQLVDVEHLYGGERVVIYYLAEGRIDFRELVKSLATEFQTRVEMRQIGVRDEAKLLADYGDCGKPVCCNTHLSEMPPVSMKMAKLQRATLDPSKISGRCGRLKCCLRYEYETYQDLQRDLPPIGSEVITNKGRARVLAQEILAGQVLIETEDMRRIVIDAADVLTVLSRGSRRKQDEATVSGSEAIIDERDVALSTLEDEPAIDEAVSRAVDATDETWDSFDANGDGDNGIAQST
jgi:cell fate regulator YaaT (PSP1 superfamily)